jgi:hypothetical protein
MAGVLGFLVLALVLQSPVMLALAVLTAAFWLFAGIVVTFGKWFADLL